jgi:hypothetical protein
MDRDLQHAKAALEKRNAELEAELAELEESMKGGGAAAAGTFSREAWAVCNASELELLQRVADAVGARNYAATARIKDELDSRIGAARLQEDVYVELCTDLLTDAERLQQLSDRLADDEIANCDPAAGGA